MFGGWLGLRCFPRKRGGELMGKGGLAVRSAVAGALLLLLSISSAWACSGLTSISPTSGPVGTVVTLTGSGFQPDGCLHGLTGADFGSTAGTALDVINETTATIVVPAGSGTVNVTAYINGSNYTLTNAFTYTADVTQTGLSKLEAQASGAAISGAVSNAITDAFDGASPVTAGTNDLAFFFAPETQAQRFNEAFGVALGYADADKRPSPFAGNAGARATADRTWNVWADVRGTGWDGHDAAAGTDGTQVNLTAGIGRKLTPDLVVGILGGYEHFDYGASALAGKLTGDGGSAGGYIGWRTHDGLRFDAAAVWSGLSYQATAGTATGSFDGSRWLVTGGVSGDSKTHGFVWTPSVRVFALWEDQSAYTDSLAVAHAAQSFSEGSVSGGLKLAYPWLSPSGAWLTPYVGAYGDFRFGSDNAVLDAPALVSPEGMSGRLTTGVAVRNARDATLTLDGELGGLGGSYLTWSANAQAAVSF